MAGENPLIQVPNPRHSLQSTPYLHSLVPHQHMRQLTNQHAFTPCLHQPSALPPAPTAMETHNSNFMHLLRGTRPSFAPVTAFHRAAEKPFRTKRGRWGALHVCIAWKIYYHKQLKKMQQTPHSHQREQTPEWPSGIRLSQQPSCMHPYGDFQCGHAADRSETGVASDLPTSSPASGRSRTSRGENPEQPPSRHWKVRHTDDQSDATKDLPHRDKPEDRTAAPERDGGRSGSRDRKRHLECDSFIKVKRAKRETGNDLTDPPKTLLTDPTPFSAYQIPVTHIGISDMSVLYPNSRNSTRTPGEVLSYPGAEMYPFQMWDVHRRKDLHSGQNDCSLNSCKGTRKPLVAQRQKEIFHGLCLPSLQFPLALRKQETAYIRRELLHSCYGNCHLHNCRQHLPHPGFLATSYLGP